MTNTRSNMFDATDSVIVIGVGRSGLATAEVLRARGASVVAFDDKPPEKLNRERDVLAKLGVPLLASGELAKAIGAATGAVLSPGVPLNHPAVLAISRAGVPVYSEIEVAYRLCDAPIIAVTGSKGKSTTTALIGHLLRADGRKVHVGGNIGDPLIKKTVAAGHDDWVVAEVSSFQLESIREFRPRISVLLNLSPDHLDRYPSMEEYGEAKYRIFANQGDGDVFVGNMDDETGARLRAGVRTIPCKTLWFSLSGQKGADAFYRDGMLHWRGDGVRPDGELIAANELHLRGAHNIENALAASLAALAAGASVKAVRDGLRSFLPLPHRLQPIANADGIVWIDDSKATNPDAVVKAIEAFTEPIVLIAGGKPKNTEFGTMCSAISKRVKAAVLIGESAQLIGRGLRGPLVAYAKSMDEAVEAAFGLAISGDVVLLSPGCASFDMFDSAEQRGEKFAAAVKARVEGNGVHAG
jgi:UDP-N-acetylmuramoylalanine--D-glutamate ligase